MSLWSRDFNRTYTEYNGSPIKLRNCNYCGRDIISDEVVKRHREVGTVCIDCIEIIREEERVWRRK